MQYRYDVDVITIEKTGENFRLVYDVKGRFTIHRITAEEAKYKLLKVKKVQLGAKGIPFVVTHDGRTLRYPDPLIKVNDTLKFDLETGKVSEFIKFEVGNVATITGGRNMGRVGVITHRERHIGGFEIVHVKDVLDRQFATRVSNVFVIGQGNKPWISLPKSKGVKLTIAEERDRCVVGFCLCLGVWTTLVASNVFTADCDFSPFEQTPRSRSRPVVLIEKKFTCYLSLSDLPLLQGWAWGAYSHE